MYYGGGGGSRGRGGGRPQWQQGGGQRRGGGGREFIPTMVYEANAAPPPRQPQYGGGPQPQAEHPLPPAEWWSGGPRRGEEGRGYGGGRRPNQGYNGNNASGQSQQQRHYHLQRQYQQPQFQQQHHYQQQSEGAQAQEHHFNPPPGFGYSVPNQREDKYEGRRRLLEEAASLLSAARKEEGARRNDGAQNNGLFYQNNAAFAKPNGGGGGYNSYNNGSGYNSYNNGGGYSSYNNGGGYTGYSDGGGGYNSYNNGGYISGGYNNSYNNGGYNSYNNRGYGNFNSGGNQNNSEYIGHPNNSGSGGGLRYNNNNSGGGRGRGEGSWRVGVWEEAAGQRERLERGLRAGGLECLVCCDSISAVDPVWSCANCHHVLHLRCTTKWATSSKSDAGWRCPACQNTTTKVPTQYFCMCGKYIDPPLMKGETPHCCGEVCGKTRPGCSHGCVLLCHPGPCPPCSANTQRRCGCGRTSQPVVCSSSAAVTCDSTCERPLNCGVHLCQEKCHSDPCKLCAVILEQTCWCGRGEPRERLCDEFTCGTVRFGCGSPCGLSLSCGAHECAAPCHPPPCPPCPLSPEVVTRCGCGATPAPESRKLCTEPLPSCGSACSKEHAGCGHPCPETCHPPPCPPCRLSTTFVCRCGRLKEETPCADAKQLLCNKRCTKKRSCGKHKCNQVCCVDTEHICPVPCNKSLNCGRHKCQQLCHKGHCQPCSNLSFEELRCECGAEVILPPVACGTRPPECTRPCPREHPCAHPPTHTCHSLPACPPCTVLQPRHCHGKHELRKSVACHVGEFSCGRECGKPAAACGHTCPAPCHPGDCPTPCRRPCSEPRPGCGHPCATPCHSGAPCPRPPPPCPAVLRLSCPCGRRSAQRPCSEHSAEYQSVATALLARTMAEVQLGRSVVTQTAELQSKINLKTLECTEECKVAERNLRLAIGLQIVNPDLSSKLSPRYPEAMRAWAKRDPRLCQLVHEKLTQLVQLAKESKQRSRSFSFDPMNREKRQFVHEYCKHFGVESVAYDQEPKRNVVATAYKDKCWLPSYSLLEVIQRESGLRKVPPPTTLLKKETAADKCPSGMKSLQSVLTLPPAKAEARPPQEKQIDYFDFTS